jgi:uncharacterized protein
MMSDYSFWGERAIDSPSLRVEVRPLFRLVYMWMGFGLLVTTVIALLTVNPGSPLYNLLFDVRGGLNEGVFFGAIIGEFALVIALSAGLRRMSVGLAAVLFFLYAAVNGFTLSLIAMIYTDASIVSAFVSTAALFGVMTVVGFTTQMDLSRYRTYFFMGLIGLVVAMVVNLFLRSSGFDLLISMFGVVLFTALTAYDTQKIKQLASDPTIQADGDLAMKFSILGALTLYLDFINLFLFLLRLFGRRR